MFRMNGIFMIPAPGLSGLRRPETFRTHGQRIERRGMAVHHQTVVPAGMTERKGFVKTVGNREFLGAVDNIVDTGIGTRQTVGGRY